MIKLEPDIQTYIQGLPFILSGLVLTEGISHKTEIYYTEELLKKVHSKILDLATSEPNSVSLYFSVNKTLQNKKLDPKVKIGSFLSAEVTKNDVLNLNALKLRFLINMSDRAKSFVNYAMQEDLSQISIHGSLLVGSKIYRNNRFEIDLTEDIDINYFDIFIESTKVTNVDE